VNEGDVACKNCQQDSWVTIGAKKYCTNCGSLANPVSIVAAGNAVGGPAQISRQSAPVQPKQPVSAQSLHGTSALASGGVLDLRKPKPAAPIVTAPATTRPASFTDIAPRPQVQPQPQPAPIAKPAAEPILVVAPRPQPAPAPKPTPAPSRPQPSLSEMAAQLSSPSEDKAIAERANLRKPVSVAAAALVVVIMGGYIWMNNYNNLSIRTASQRAGIIASLPQYTPGNYKLNGPISYGTGFVSFNLKNSKDSGKSIAVIQRKSEWNSASLLELYVSPKTKDYVAVDSQGLKIYLYGDGKATWVNKGLQYVVTANSSLSRDQIVKMAQSL